ncbi:Subunit of heterotrimeric Replication Protein A (RPA) [Methanohalobium evestigatum Z-7303]|uniref:Subunit of heterotrimeric Replication Protein A (RPA) n=1 Tax=Methanohalobium evestigatum (strain ATCC BAA-1072 / DSM 3721 / NBRC 107634 / OCM 161 / Z-7303) TaxID=644295 RepID=D7E6Q2_METEZ|nr:hypothetical protein [Methanohalobium evestigatum]ADI73274.1 Subunit of heterotrimeric Replication Protein A (RPA) [Methanohalobium evestigatum Z-7303]
MVKNIKVVSDGFSFTIWIDGEIIENVLKISVVQGTALPKDSNDETITTISYGGYDPEDFMNIIEGPYSYSYLKSSGKKKDIDKETIDIYGEVMYYYPSS